MELFYDRDEKPPIQHAVHAVMTAISCGLWLPVWGIAWLTHEATPPPMDVFARARGRVHDE